MSENGANRSEGHSEGHRAASSLELFLDLAFVFALSQISAYLAHDLTVGGALRALLLSWFAWWQWTAFTWVGGIIDLKAKAALRVMVLCLVPLVLLVAVALPRALTDQAVWFAGAYCVVQLWVLAIQWVAMAEDASSLAAFKNYAPLAAVGPVLMFGAAFLAETPRLWAWVAVAVIFVASALAGAKGESVEWSLVASHFAERHSLFIIIALGEVLVAIGVNTANTPEMSALSFAALVAASAVACSLWWAYFAYIPQVFEHALDTATPQDRGTVARDIGSFIHFPLICGIVAFAVLAEHVVHRPDEHLHSAEQVLVAAVGLLVIGSFVAMQWRLTRTVSSIRFGGWPASFCSQFWVGYFRALPCLLASR